jgi:hypothetical protein
MIVVRNVFIAKPGSASKLAAQVKEAATAANMGRFRVLTDLTGEFNRVVLEFEGEGLADFEARMREYNSNSVLRDKMKGYTDLYLTGTREIFQVV